jgi:hypothetical protein
VEGLRSGCASYAAAVRPAARRATAESHARGSMRLRRRRCPPSTARAGWAANSRFRSCPRCSLTRKLLTHSQILRMRGPRGRGGAARPGPTSVDEQPRLRASAPALLVRDEDDDAAEVPAADVAATDYGTCRSRAPSSVGPLNVPRQAKVGRPVSPPTEVSTPLRIVPMMPSEELLTLRYPCSQRRRRRRRSPACPRRLGSCQFSVCCPVSRSATHAPAPHGFARARVRRVPVRLCKPARALGFARERRHCARSPEHPLLQRAQGLAVCSSSSSSVSM